jgi:predicted nuclease of predicted toxin-antitoxin system
VKFKLDENLGATALRSFETAGYDTSTVYLQDLAGAPDDDVLRICTAERRILVTLDLDSANLITYDPRSNSGIVVLCMSRNPAPSELTAPLRRYFRHLSIARLETAYGSYDTIESVCGSLPVTRDQKASQHSLVR